MNEPKRVWIICKPCEDHYYAGSPTGMVFLEEEDAKEYLRGANNPAQEPHDTQLELYSVKGYLQ